MLGHGTRDARRTERYLDGLMAADDRRAQEVPVDADLDPAIRLAARELRSGLTRVHPSFRFEDALAARLAAGALRMRAGLPLDEANTGPMPGTLAQFRRSESGADVAAAPDTEASATPVARGHALSPAAWRRLPDRSTRPSRPLIVGGVGVGVASAAISIGAVYVAWRHSHPASGRMGRAVRAAHGRSSHPSHSRRAGVINGILGVVS
jgi:hypothetical protein